MISTHCPLHYNGYLQPQQQQAQQQQQPQQTPPQPLGTGQGPPQHIYAQNPQMRLQPMPGSGGGVGDHQQQQSQRINQQQHQQHHSHHNPQQQHHQQQQPQTSEQQIRINQMYPPNAGSGQPKGMMPGGKGMMKTTACEQGTNVVYPQKATQFRKYNTGAAAPPSSRADPKGPKLHSVSMVDHSHIPTVSANGIPGAAETTVTNLRNMQNSSSSSSTSVPNGTILSNLSSDEKCGGGGLDGMLGKEKTAMCLVNELSRFNKLTQQYRLTNEQGPAHQKRFTVTLTLGKEEYMAEGGSIKKAQHAAASEAIQKTKYRHPPAKAHPVRSESVNLTPTVELNALAMKRREKAVYIFDPPPATGAPGVGLGNAMSHHGPLPGGYAGGGHQQGHYGASAPNFAYRGMNGAGGVPPLPHMMGNRRFPGGGGGGPAHLKMGDMAAHPGMAGSGRGRPMMKAGGLGGGGSRMMRGGGVGGMGMLMGAGAAPPLEQVHVTLEVGGLQFTGFGFTAQAARHNAASKALEVMRKMPTDGAEGGSAVGTGGADDSVTGEGSSGAGGKPDSKSPVSMIHEIALKRSMTVAFSVKNETGPSHMKVFFTVCSVGDISVEGQGNSKKASKKHAAEKMYQELLKLPPIQGALHEGGGGAGGAAGAGGPGGLKGSTRPKKKPQEAVKKKPKQIIKPEVEPVEELNAISRLMQIQQAKKGKEPVYLLVDQRGTARRREFEMSVEVDGITMMGTGPNKKLAKRIAAEKLLAALGYEVKVTSSTDNAEAEGSPVRSSTVAVEKGAKKHSVSESVDSGVAHSPPVVSANGTAATLTEGGAAAGKKAKAAKRDKAAATTVVETATIALTEVESSKTESGSDGARPKDQLIYLSKIIGFKVQFSDFPKGNHGEYLTLITLNTDPPQLCHGSGKTLEASHDQAALTTLNLLSELGLDNVRPKAVAVASTAKGKGPSKGGETAEVVVGGSTEGGD